MCEFTTDHPDSSEDEFNYLVICPYCMHKRWTLHCVHEGRRKCPKCHLLAPALELDDDTDYASAEGRKAYMNLEYARILRGALNGR